jgi:hypothetical protein
MQNAIQLNVQTLHAGEDAAVFTDMESHVFQALSTSRAASASSCLI